MGRAQLADAAAIALVLLCVASSIGLASALPVDLTNDNFDERVRERPADSWVLVDFFASWWVYEAATHQNLKPRHPRAPRPCLRAQNA